MRGIKFRGLSDGTWVYGSHVQTGSGLHFIIPQNLIANDIVQWVVNQKTVGQYTGLNDKNGKEIYEGNIVSVNYLGFHKFNAVVKLGQYIQDGSGGEYLGTKCIGFYVEAINKDQNDEYDIKEVPEYLETSSLLSFDSIKVIGNIYENPELLEVSL